MYTDSIIVTDCLLWNALPDITQFIDKRAHFGASVWDVMRWGLL